MIDLLTLWVAASTFFSIGRILADGGRSSYSKKGRIKTNLNAFGLIMNIYDHLSGIDWKRKLLPKTRFEKKIADDLKQIKVLERQKVLLEEKERVEERKNRLFEEVNEKEAKVGDMIWVPVRKGRFEPCPDCGESSLHTMTEKNEEHNELTYWCIDCHEEWTLIEDKEPDVVIKWPTANMIRKEMKMDGHTYSHPKPTPEQEAFYDGRMTGTDKPLVSPPSLGAASAYKKAECYMCGSADLSAEVLIAYGGAKSVMTTCEVCGYKDHELRLNKKSKEMEDVEQ